MESFVCLDCDCVDRIMIINSVARCSVCGSDEIESLGKAWTEAPKGILPEDEGHFEGGFYYNPLVADSGE